MMDQQNERVTEQDKMRAGLWYDANFDPELLALRAEAEELCHRLNQTSPKDVDQLGELFAKLLPRRGNDVTIMTPFHADYGSNCVIGDHTFINHNAYLMDCAKITIGSWCFIGPSCGMYTAVHPLLPAERNKGLEQARPITIGDNVWIGGDVTILPGVTIGDGAVIGAGSVVTRDIPAGVVAVGNPCRVLREITQQDSIEEASR